jgi:hypothetical protein
MRWLPVLATILYSVTAGAADDWGPIQFLVGRWTGEGNGAPGQGTGGFSFLPDLQGKVLVRKNFAEYPPTGGKPALRHDDLMIVYREEGSPELQAIYFDNEGHVIRYSVKPLAGGGVVMESGGPPGEPRYRMTYTSGGPDLIVIKFQIAPPGKEFAGYIEATARRESSKTPQ